MKKLLLLLLISCFLLASCGKSEMKAPELMDPVSANVDTEAVARGDIVNILTYDGSLVPASIELYFETDGIIDVIAAYSGKYVNEGDALITLETDALDKEIKTVEDEIENIETEGNFEDRIKQLDIDYLNLELQQLKENSASAQAISLKQIDIENAELQLSQTRELREARLKDMKDRLKKLGEERNKKTLVAPISGYLYVMDYAEEGAYVRSERAICYIIDESSLTLVVDGYIGSTYVDRYHIYAWIDGEPWELEYQQMTDQEIRAAVLAGKTLKTTFLLNDEKDTSRLKAGMYCGLILELTLATDTLYVPSDAVRSEHGSAYVYVMNDLGTREKRTVKRGVTNAIQTEILEGLEEGEVVYVQN